jgi:hypothetical protein
MSHPFPLMVEASYQRSEAMRRARQERLANMVMSQPATGHSRFGREAARVAGVFAHVTSPRTLWCKIVLSRAAA